jgi:hypothetical protein
LVNAKNQYLSLLCSQLFAASPYFRQICIINIWLTVQYIHKHIQKSKTINCKKYVFLSTTLKTTLNFFPVYAFHFVSWPFHSAIIYQRFLLFKLMFIRHIHFSYELWMLVVAYLIRNVNSLSDLLTNIWLNNNLHCF